MLKSMKSKAGLGVVIGLVAALLIPAAAHAGVTDRWTTCTATTKARATTSSYSQSSSTTHFYTGNTHGGSGTNYTWQKDWASSTATRTSYSGMWVGNVQITILPGNAAVSTGCYKI